jgi:hypothetical protein
MFSPATTPRWANYRLQTIVVPGLFPVLWHHAHCVEKNDKGDGGVFSFISGHRSRFSAEFLRVRAPLSGVRGVPGSFLKFQI